MTFFQSIHNPSWEHLCQMCFSFAKSLFSIVNAFINWTMKMVLSSIALHNFWEQASRCSEKQWFYHHKQHHNKRQQCFSMKINVSSFQRCFIILFALVSTSGLIITDSDKECLEIHTSISYWHAEAKYNIYAYKSLLCF